MARKYHVWSSADDLPEEGGSYELIRTISLKANALRIAGSLLDEGLSVQIIVEENPDV